MNRRVLEILDRLDAPRIFVAGDLILDRYIWGSVDRISPEAPVQVLNVQREEARLGGAGNVARNLVTLGAISSCAGVVGKDAEGATLLRLLRSSSIGTEAVVRNPERPTPVKTRMIAHSQQVLRVDREDPTPLSGGTERSLVSACVRAARTHEAAIISDYSKGTLTDRVSRKTIEAFRKAGRPVLVGLKGHDYRKFRGATGASLNRRELALLARQEDVPRAAQWLLNELHLRYLVVTLGERGMFVTDAAGKSFELPAAARAVYDVTGAGDTALATFGLGFARGLPLEDCAILANAAAGVVVGKVGTEAVTRAEVAEGGEGHREKIVSVSLLQRLLEGERRRGKTVVFTNGVYDLLHPGHLKLLEFARSKGDVLVVGVNTDRSVRRLKGDSRPILGEAERTRVLAALEVIDYVVLFDEDTPERLIRAVRPEVLVKGEDYAGKKVVGREFVERNGGTVHLAPFEEGFSTSALVDRIRNRRGKR